MRLPVMSGAAFGINWEDPRKEREAGRAAEEHLQGRDSGQDKWGLRALHRAAKEGGWLVVLSELDMGKRELVGEGTVGQVHKCKHLPSGDHCAVKGVRPSLSEDSLDRNRTMEDLVNEIKMLSSIGRHPNVVRFVGVLFDGSHASHEAASRPALVLEYLAGRSLQDVIDDKSHGVHRDIKASNLFCSPDLTRVKLGDFGLCRPVKNRADQRAMTGLTGSYMHMAPEVFLCQQDYSEKADIFSAAVCMVSLLTGRPPYERDFEQYGNFPDVLARRVAQEGYRMSLGAVHPAGMAPLISSMWDTDPACRPTAREARQEVTRVLVAAEKSVFQPIASLVTSVIASFEGVSRLVNARVTGHADAEANCPR
ncbi:kinase-like domain-containing protein [Baffinella frigidus]|nr:kinase-like domain-containing protein [Cryptophyta sp. CCMP2293]